MSVSTTKKKFDPAEKLSPTDRTAVTAVMYNLVFMNEIAISQMFDTMNEIEGTRYYRHRVKRWIRKVREMMADYNKLLDKRTGGMIDFLADLNDKYEEQLDLDMFKLRNACLNVLNKAKVKESSLVASVYISGTLICGATYNNDNCMTGFPHLAYFARYFKWLRLTDMENAYMHVVNELMSMMRVDYQRMLDDDVTVQNGFKALANKLHDADNIIDICNAHAREWDKED